MHTAVLILIVLVVAAATFVVGRMAIRRGRAEDAAPAADPARIPAASAFVPADGESTWIDLDAAKVRDAAKAKRD